MKKYEAICMAVHDGDSLKIKFEDVVKWMRLYAVDTPELVSNYITESQPMGVEVGNIMRKMVKTKTLTVTEFGVDMYDRPLFIAELNGKDLCLYLLENGLAWYIPLKKGEKNLLPTGVRKNYFAAFQMAKRQKLGIWANKNAVSPSVWRANHRRVTSLVESTYAEFGFDFGDEYPS